MFLCCIKGAVLNPLSHSSPSSAKQLPTINYPDYCVALQKLAGNTVDTHHDRHLALCLQPGFKAVPEGGANTC